MSLNSPSQPLPSRLAVLKRHQTKLVRGLPKAAVLPQGHDIPDTGKFLRFR